MDALLEVVGDARFVLIGEATHGTHEFYQLRADLTARLIEQRGFTAVAVEADWPDAYRVNRYVRAVSDDNDADEALADFQRFPRWMWRNTVVLSFVEWLRAFNDARRTGAARVGFFGLDLYSLHASIDAVVDYLNHVDPDAARRARDRYGCFDHFGGDAQGYGYATSLGVAEPCEDEVVAQLIELQRRAAELARPLGSPLSGESAADAFFYAEQNARLAKNAEAYYRAMFRGRASSWNLRDRHMAETLDALVAHLDRSGAATKVVVWAHNSHLGDARATEMGASGELNLGQLVRERYGRASCLVGLTTYAGSVAAASDWGEPVEHKRVRPALPGSYEDLFHELATMSSPNFLLNLRNGGDAAVLLRSPRLQRAIGVVYRPETERVSHYFEARLADQFDALVYLDQTRALVPLERAGDWESGDAPETYPFAE
jgi:erythromycin esterase-like protein